MTNPNPTLASERAAQCHNDYYAGIRTEGRTNGHVQQGLCLYCARAYARQVGEAWKAQALDLTEFTYPCQRSETRGTCPHENDGWSDCYVAAIRDLPVEAP